MATRRTIVYRPSPLSDNHIQITFWKTSLVEKMPFIGTFSPQIIRPATNNHISPGSIKNMGQGVLVSVQICPLVPVCFRVMSRN
jgi:hypothetical protein